MMAGVQGGFNQGSIQPPLGLPHHASATIKLVTSACIWRRPITLSTGPEAITFREGEPFGSRRIIPVKHAVIAKPSLLISR